MCYVSFCVDLCICETDDMNTIETLLVTLCTLYKTTTHHHHPPRRDGVVWLIANMMCLPSASKQNTH